MSLQRQQRRSSEVRGCLLRNFLDMRKRSLIRSESQDSGFSLEYYEPFVNSSFDAEKFLEELGFAGDNAPLIPDRFIPSLIHRISNMPDETVKKLDTRVWNSIDSFKKKEHTLWFFTQSSVECDLCLNDLQRSYSLPAEFVHDSCDSLYPGNSIYATGNPNSSASRVQNWLSRFTGDSLTLPDQTKANIAYIGNQSSTESGILSAFSDDEVSMYANPSEGPSVNDPCCLPKRVDSFGLSVQEVESLKPSAGLYFEECRTLKPIPSTTPSHEVHDSKTVNVNIALCLETTPAGRYKTRLSDIVSPTDACISRISPVSTGEICLYECTNIENSSLFLRSSNAAGKGGHYKSVAENANQFPIEHKQYDFNQLSSCGQMLSLTENLESDTRNIFGVVEDSTCCCINGEEEDGPNDIDSCIRRASSPSKGPDGARFDMTKKRHSFDSASLTAAEKRKRFRLSHSRTHSALFKKEDNCLSGSHLSGIPGDDETPSYSSTNYISNPREETEVQHSDQLKLQKGGEGTQNILHQSGSSVDIVFEVSDIVNSLETSHSNGASSDTLLEVSNIVSSITNRRGANSDTPLEVPNILSSVNTSHSNGSSSDTPLEVSNIVSSVDTSQSKGANSDTPLEVSNIVSSVDISHPNGASLDSPLEMSNIVGVVDSSHPNGASSDTPSEVSNIVSSVDTSHLNGASSYTPLEVSSITSNVNILDHNGCDLDADLEISDMRSNVDIFNHTGGNLDTTLEVSDTVSNEHICQSSTDSPSLVSDVISNANITSHDEKNLGTTLELSDIVHNIEQLKTSGGLSRSDSESSEQYFSCDELVTTFSENDGGKGKKGIPVEPANLFPCSPAQQRAKTASQMFLGENALFRNCNRNTYAKYKEQFILNKILKRNLKLSVLCPMEKISRNFLLENDRNDNETFSQILNMNEPPNSLRAKVLEKQSVPYGESGSCDTLLNASLREKSVERMVDKERGTDNSQSIISKPFVRNLSLTSDMFSPKCEVRLIDYDGLALFWAARNKAESSISCDSGFTNSTHSSSDSTLNKRYRNGVHMNINNGNEAESTNNNKVYLCEVRLEVNSEEAERDLAKEGVQRSVAAEKFESEDDEVQVENSSISKTPTNTENPCGRALKDLEDLRTAIRKAKETRVSASRELKLLQELLHGSDNEGDETMRTTPTVSESTLSLPDVGIVNEYHGKGKITEALAELQQKSTKEASQNKEFWEDEIRKTKEEISEAFHEKLSVMEEKLRLTEDELDRALRENTRLKDQLEIRSATFPECKCNAEAQQHSDFSHMNGISDEDPKIIPVQVKPSLPTKNFWKEWDRLQSDLMKAENKADELNILLNQKLIELNRMQLALSKQTKEMVLLEKAYFQLRSHLSKRKLNKSTLSHHSSSAGKTLSTERASETSSKTDPEIPP